MESERLAGRGGIRLELYSNLLYNNIALLTCVYYMEEPHVHACSQLRTMSLLQVLMNSQAIKLFINKQLLNYFKEAIINTHPVYVLYHKVIIIILKSIRSADAVVNITGKID